MTDDDEPSAEMVPPVLVTTELWKYSVPPPVASSVPVFVVVGAWMVSVPPELIMPWLFTPPVTEKDWPPSMLKELVASSIFKLSIVALMSIVTAEAAGISTLYAVLFGTTPRLHFVAVL